MPNLVRVVGGIVVVEGGGGVIVAVALVVRALLGHDQHAASGYGTAAWFAILGGGVLAAGAGLVLGRRWGRAIAVITQLLLLPVSWALLTDSHRPELGAPLGILAIATLALLFSAPFTRWYTQDA